MGELALIDRFLRVFERKLGCTFADLFAKITLQCGKLNLRIFDFCGRIVTCNILLLGQSGEDRTIECKGELLENLIGLWWLEVGTGGDDRIRWHFF